eukprot:29158-Rhodomonas_salina.1
MHTPWSSTDASASQAGSPTSPTSPTSPSSRSSSSPGTSPPICCALAMQRPVLRFGMLLPARTPPRTSSSPSRRPSSSSSSARRVSSSPSRPASAVAEP